jgi:hypothetical protein
VLHHKHSAKCQRLLCANLAHLPDNALSPHNIPPYGTIKSRPSSHALPRKDFWAREARPRIPQRAKFIFYSFDLEKFDMFEWTPARYSAGEG